MNDPQEPCPFCAGNGFIENEYSEYVTREMALDAGNPDYEGAKITSRTISTCPECGGLGYILEEEK